MGELTKNFKKEEVYYFKKEVSKLLDLLNGTTIVCNGNNRTFTIENQMNKIESLLYKYEPTIYEEYSIKTKDAYNNMIKARKEYEKLKDYRNKLKSALEQK